MYTFFIISNLAFLNPNLWAVKPQLGRAMVSLTVWETPSQQVDLIARLKESGVVLED